MKKILAFIGAAAAAAAAAGAAAFACERIREKEAEQSGFRYQPHGIYERFLKRPLDCMLATGALIVLSPVLLILTAAGAVMMGGNPFFTQERPGRDEKIFKLIKFRTMNNKKDKDGNLLPDEVRLTKYGRWLRSTSLDELPELYNIIRGDMSIIGPRPQLVRDMVFMSDRQRMRHAVRPGMSGLAQTNGRNAITWDAKLQWDLEYISKITLAGDVRLILRTIMQVFVRKKDDTNAAETDVTLDYGDELLRDGKVSKEEYDALQAKAKEILREYERCGS